jgi:hypothetical protein
MTSGYPMLGFATTVGATELHATCGVIETASAQTALTGCINAAATKSARRLFAVSPITVFSNSRCYYIADGRAIYGSQDLPKF